MAQPRGIRNNNPLNIIKSNVEWEGKIPVECNTDGTFEQFKSLDLGIRAAVQNLLAHIRRDRRQRIRTTVRDEIFRWCPDNTAPGYTAFVCKKANLEPNEILDDTNKNQICRLLWAMSHFENGYELPFNYFERQYDLL